MSLTKVSVLSAFICVHLRPMLFVRPWHTSPALQIALPLPAGHDAVVGVLLDPGRVHIVLHHILAEDLSREGALLQQLRRFPECPRDPRHTTCLIAVAPVLRGRLDP